MQHTYLLSATYGAFPFSTVNGMYLSSVPGYMPSHPYPMIIMNQAPPQQQWQHPLLLEMLCWNLQQTIIGLHNEMERMRWRFQPPAPYQKERPHYRQNERHVPRFAKTRMGMTDPPNPVAKKLPSKVITTENSSHSSSPVSEDPSPATAVIETQCKSDPSPDPLETARVATVPKENFFFLDASRENNLAVRKKDPPW